MKYLLEKFKQKDSNKLVDYIDAKTPDKFTALSKADFSFKPTTETAIRFTNALIDFRQKITKDDRVGLELIVVIFNQAAEQVLFPNYMQEEIENVKKVAFDVYT